MLKKTWIAAAILAAHFPAAFSAENFFEIGENGILTASGNRIELVHYTSKWEITEAQRAVSADAGFPKRPKDCFELKGKLNVRNGTFNLHETFRQIGTDGGELEILLDSEKGIPTGAVFLRIQLPLPQSIRTPVLADEKPLKFGEKFDEANMRIKASNLKKLRIPFRNGILTVEGASSVAMQDNRKWNLNKWELRIGLEKNSPITTAARIKLKFTVENFRSTPVSLAKAANMGFLDEKANDGKGGWTDQGPENDMRSFPVGKQNFANIPFEIVDPAKNGGKGCIVLQGPMKPDFPKRAEVVLPAPAKGKYLYVLNAVGWHVRNKAAGGIQVEYDKAQYVDKDIAYFTVKCGTDTENFWSPRWLPNAVVAWKGFNPSSAIGLYLSCFELTGADIRKITFESANNMVWMIAGVTLSDIPPQIIAKEESVSLSPNADWSAVKNRVGVKPGSILDFSGMLDAPAGKYGFVKTENGHFEFTGRPGKKVRFQGTNYCFTSSRDSKQLAERMADEIASMGYNIVRLHHFDIVISAQNGKSSRINPVHMDNLDYVLYAFKKRGIYITIDLHTQRRMKKGELPERPDETLSAGTFTTLTFINDSVRKNFEEFSANLLNHVNPYTKTAWKDEPAIAAVSILNEDTLYGRIKNAPSWVRGMYERKFEKWLESRKFTLHPENREHLFQYFLSEVYLEGYAKMKKFLRELGVKVPLTDQNLDNWVPLTALRDRCDYVDNHIYWAHPSFLEKTWRYPVIVHNHCATANSGGSLPRIFPTRIYGKPFTVSEWCFCGPNRYSMEGSFLIGAYAALQDWDGLCIFTYAHGENSIRKPEESSVGWFDIVSNPLKKLSERAGICLFLRGDVRPSGIQFPVLIDDRYWENGNGLLDYPAPIQKLGLLGGTGSLVAKNGKVPELPKGSAALTAMPGKKWNKAGLSVPFYSDMTDGLYEKLLNDKIVSARELDVRNNRFRSDTKEILLDSGEAQFSVITPRSEGFVLNKDQSISGKFASVKNKRCFAAFMFASKDMRPLRESSRILILHLTDSKNAGTIFRNKDMSIMENQGTPPVLIRSGEAEVCVNRSLNGFKLHAVDFDGSRMYEVPMSIKDGKTAFRLSTAKNGKVAAAYELIKESRQQ